MDKVYLVTKGEYSDYRVVAVFSKKELADIYAEKIIGEVEGFYIDGIEVCRDYTIYKVTRQFDCKVRVRIEKDSDIADANSHGFNNVYKEQVSMWEPFQYSVYVKAKNEEKAKKIGLDYIYKKEAIDKGV